MTAHSTVDLASALWYKRTLELKRPGTRWDITIEGSDECVSPVAARREIARAYAARVDDKEVGVAA